MPASDCHTARYITFATLTRYYHLLRKRAGSQPTRHLHLCNVHTISLASERSTRMSTSMSRVCRCGVGHSGVEAPQKPIPARLSWNGIAACCGHVLQGMRTLACRCGRRFKIKRSRCATMSALCIVHQLGRSFVQLCLLYNMLSASEVVQVPWRRLAS